MVNGEDVPMTSASMSQAAIGRAMNLSPAAMTKLKKQGMPVNSLEAALAWRLARQNIAQRKPLPSQVIAHRQSVVPAATSASSGSDETEVAGESHDEARTRREIAEADLAELKLRELRGELIRRDIMERIVGERAAATRESVLQIKARLAPLLAAESDVAKVTALLDAELRAALDKAAG